MVIHFFEGATKVSVKEDSCEDCAANLVDVSFKVRNSSILFCNTAWYNGQIF